MWNRIGWVLVAVSAFGQAFGQTEEVAPARDVVPEAYEVYSAALPDEWAWKYSYGNALVINEQTVSYEMCLKPDDDSKDVVGPAIEDFLEVNKTKWLLQRQFQIEKPYELAPAGQSAAVLKANAQSSLLSISAVGFNKDKTVAVFYMGHTCGSLCGGGQFYVLEKKEGKWRNLVWHGSACMWAS